MCILNFFAVLYFVRLLCIFVSCFNFVYFSKLICGGIIKACFGIKVPRFVSPVLLPKTVEQASFSEKSKPTWSHNLFVCQA